MSEPRVRNRTDAWRRRLIIGALIAILATPAANDISRRIAVAYLGSLVDGNASIARLRLGLRQVTVDGIAVRSGPENIPLFSVDRVAIDVTLWEGIRRGVWLGQIVVEQPQIQLHFSRDGSLITSLPALFTRKRESTPIGQLPFRAIQVRSARFAIHQQGRQSLDIENLSLVVVAQSNQLNVTAVAPKLFGGECQLKSAIDLETMAAESLLKINGVQVSSTEIARLPLVPASVNAQPWRGSTSFEIRQTGLLNSLGNCNAVVDLKDLELAIKGHPTVELAGTVTAREGTIESRIRGKALGGLITLDGQLALTADGPSGTAILQCQHLATESLPPGLVPDGVRILASVGMNVSGTLVDDMIQLRGEGTATVNETDIQGIAVAPVHAGCRCRRGHRSSGRFTSISWADHGHHRVRWIVAQQAGHSRCTSPSCD